jgi:hypothetical protein
MTHTDRWAREMTMTTAEKKGLRILRNKEKGIPRKRWRGDVEEDSNTVGIKKTGRKWQKTIGNGGTFYWQPRSMMTCSP